VKRRWKIALGLLATLAILLAVNTVTTDSQTKEAGVTAEGGEILELSRGAVQATDTGNPEGSGQPVVLLHCYACSLHWYDALEPLLAENHRVIRVDLLGFGGSEKPESGYEIEAQAQVVAEALNQHSMGAAVAASLAEQASQLVDRAVVIDMAPNTNDFGGGLPFLAKLGYVPVLGEALWRITPDFAVRDAYQESFAPDFDVESGFEDPDQVLADYDAMTYTSYDAAPAATDDFLNHQPLDERFQGAPVPLLVIFGAEDQIFDAERAVEGFGDVPGVRTEIVDGAGHAPQVEQPEAVASLLEGFAVELAPVSDPDRSRGGKRDAGGADRPRDDERGKRRKKDRKR